MPVDGLRLYTPEYYASMLLQHSSTFDCFVNMLLCLAYDTYNKRVT